MKVKLSIIIGVAFSVITGCRKVNDAQPQGTLLLSQITNVNTGQVFTLKYDDQNRLIEDHDSQSANDYIYVYDSNDRLIQKTQSDGLGSYRQDTYTYTTGVINVSTSTKYYQSSSVSTSSSSYVLNDKQQIVKFNIDNSGKNYEIYSYDAAGNLSAEIGYLNGLATPSYQSIFTYDQNKSLFANVKGNTILTTSNVGANNISQALSTDFVYSSRLPVTIKNTYEYNGQGFPTKQTLVQNTQATTATTTTVYVYTYITK